MPFGAMANHTVGGIDCFVDCSPRETGNGKPQHRRDNTGSEKFSARLSIAARASAGFHRAPRYRGRRYTPPRGTGRREAIALDCGCDVRHMAVQAAFAIKKPTPSPQR